MDSIMNSNKTEGERVVGMDNYLGGQRLMLFDATTPAYGHPSLLKEGNGATFKIFCSFAYSHIVLFTNSLIHQLTNFIQATCTALFTSVSKNPFLCTFK